MQTAVGRRAGGQQREQRKTDTRMGNFSYLSLFLLLLPFFPLQFTPVSLLLTSHSSCPPCLHHITLVSKHTQMHPQVRADIDQLSRKAELCVLRVSEVKCDSRCKALQAADQAHCRRHSDRRVQTSCHVSHTAQYLCTHLSSA